MLAAVTSTARRTLASAARQGGRFTCRAAASVWHPRSMPAAGTHSASCELSSRRRPTNHVVPSHPRSAAQVGEWLAPLSSEQRCTLGVMKWFWCCCGLWRSASATQTHASVACEQQCTCGRTGWQQLHEWGGVHPPCAELAVLAQTRTLHSAPLFNCKHSPGRSAHRPRPSQHAALPRSDLREHHLFGTAHQTPWPPLSL